MKYLVVALPMVLGVVVPPISSMAMALQAAGGSVSLLPEWGSLIFTQGICAVLVIWWIVKGYPMWLEKWEKSLDKQGERFDVHRHEMIEEAKLTRETLTELLLELRQRPCVMEKPEHANPKKP